MKRYLDHNATCPPVRAAVEAMVRASAEAYGNPSSLHWAGRAARRVVDDARDALARYVDCESGSVVFTSGGTESNNIAIHSVLAACRPGRIVTTAIEHPAILKPLQQFVDAAGSGWELIVVRPQANGRVSDAALLQVMTEDTRLVCMMMANNETGAVQPVATVAAHCRRIGVPVLVDAVQALGKQSISFRQLDVDFMSLSGHKIGGPKGVGALIVRRGVRVSELSPGGGQERARRSGTENVPGIAGFAAALGVVDFAAIAQVRDDFEAYLRSRIADAEVISADVERTPNTSLVILPGMDGETMLMQLDLAGFAVASGSACSSGKREPSHVLLAMGVAETRARSSIRVSFGPANTAEDGRALVEALVVARNRLKGMAGLAV
ncbi:cysteine desulfurase [Mariprofundus erugo]|uniref:cysteine desulfurase n=1 Tax=Mariprofundus erugo TaxID=2528639 RepID=A0A5R9GQB3_9PROT|nr:cysteine desulfurase family protein [Mariprofundus erugo]TLS68140.1 cysteine desulfurase [Mariprofundus erugo]